MDKQNMNTKDNMAIQYPIKSPLLSEAQAISYLRLDTIGHKHPARTLKYYRSRKMLRACQISKKLFYSLNELDSFIKRITEK
jgi:hypothetical protein